MAKRYYWLKLKADWFSDKRIKKLRSIAGGDTHTIIYLKMMLLSLKDEGKLYFEGVEDNFASEIALALDEDAENVKLTLAFLQRHGLIEIGDDDEYQLTEVPTIIGSETASTIRSRECGERKKQLALGQKVLQCNTRKIHIDKQLQRTREGKYIIADTKTTYGERYLPMSEEVYQCFKKLIAKRKKVKVDPMIDGVGGFLVLDQNGMPYLALHWEKRFEYALGKYNRTFKEELPTITPHVCRHTYCSNMAKSGVSPKTLQYLMGHADIATTLNVYTHLKYDDVEKEVRELEERLRKEV